MKQEVNIRRYSIPFKQQVVREYEGGASIQELREKYGIGGGNTIQSWLKKYGREGLRHKLLVIQQPAEQNQIKELKKRNKQLEEVVAQLSLDKLLLEATVAEMEEVLGPDFKKKDAPKSSKKPSRTNKGSQ